MRKIIITSICLLFLTQNAFGLTPIGFPTAALEEGKYELSFSYLHSEMDIEASFYGLSDHLNTKVNGYLPQLDIGLGDDWQLSLGLGVADMDADGLNNANAFGGIGIKKTFARQGDIDWGASFQMYWSSFYDEVVLLPPSVSEIDISYHEIQFAVGPTYKKDNWCLYGGPFIHYLNGDMDVNDVSAGNISYDFEKDLGFGAFVGFSVNLTENTNFGFEAQFIEDAQAIIFRFSYRF